MKIGALEAGGTKMICSICDHEANIFDSVEIPTKKPEETMPLIVEFFKKYEDIEAIGVGSFGPVDLNRNSETYGYITYTPKLDWKNYNIIGELKKNFDLPIGFDTDVNAALLGEVEFGSAKGKENAIYITIGTGVGMGIMSNGKLIHGLMHPEAGHVLLQKHPDDNFDGICPYHKNCAEGMASGPAIEKRWGDKAFNLSENKKVWEIEAYYIAQSIFGLICTTSPEIIILGGGVMKQEFLFDMIREELIKINNNYISVEELKDINKLRSYIVPAKLEGKQGIIGSMVLGYNEFKRVKGL